MVCVTSTSAYLGQGQKVQEAMVQPIHLLFRYLSEQVTVRTEGCVTGFDEYTNLVLDGAEEIHSRTVKETTGSDHAKRR